MDLYYQLGVRPLDYLFAISRKYQPTVSKTCPTKSWSCEDSHCSRPNIASYTPVHSLNTALHDKISIQRSSGTLQVILYSIFVVNVYVCLPDISMNRTKTVMQGRTTLSQLTEFLIKKTGFVWLHRKFVCR